MRVQKKAALFTLPTALALDRLLAKQWAFLRVVSGSGGSSRSAVGL